MADDTKVKQLCALLEKLSGSSRHFDLAVTFDGSKYKWKFTVGGIRAEEISLAKQCVPRNMYEGKDD